MTRGAGRANRVSRARSHPDRLRAAPFDDRSPRSLLRSPPSRVDANRTGLYAQAAFASAGKVTIYLKKTVTASTPIGYLVIN